MTLPETGWLLASSAASVISVTIIVFMIMVAYQAFYLPWNTARMAEIAQASKLLSEDSNREAQHRLERQRVEAQYWRLLFRTYGIIATGLLLILIPVTILSYNSYERLQPPPFSPPLTIQLPNDSATYQVNLSAPDGIDDMDSASATLTISRIDNTRRADHYSSLEPRLFSSNIDLMPVDTDKISADFASEVSWRWLLSAHRDGKESIVPRYGDQVLESILVYHSKNGSHVILGPEARLRIRHSVTNEAITSNIGSLLSFALGIVTLLFGIFRTSKQSESADGQNPLTEAQKSLPKSFQSPSALT